MPTTASADFSQFVVTTANETVCETSRDKPVSLSSSTCLIYAHKLRLPFGLRCFEPAYPPCTPYIRFLFVRLRFRYPFFSPTPHDVNLGSRYGVRRQLRPLWTFTTDRQHARHTQKRLRDAGRSIPEPGCQLYDSEKISGFSEKESSGRKSGHRFHVKFVDFL